MGAQEILERYKDTRIQDSAEKFEGLLLNASVRDNHLRPNAKLGIGAHAGLP